MNNNKISRTPDLVIRLAASTVEHTDILKIFKQHNIKDYVYTIETERAIVKHGMSANTTGPCGERIYRQLGHLLGWNTRLTGSSGSEMRIVADDYEQAYGEQLTRWDVTLKVYNMTDVPEAESYCLDFERGLINESIRTDGCAPVGNVDATTRRAAQAEKNMAQILRLFEVEC